MLKEKFLLLQTFVGIDKSFIKPLEATIIRQHEQTVKDNAPWILRKKER